MMGATISDVYKTLSGPSPAYREKQLHRVPNAKVVVRETFLLERCKGKIVLDIGASGPMHEQIVQVARRTFGIDRPTGSDSFPMPSRGDAELGNDVMWGIDLDDFYSELPVLDEVQVVICGEVIEHLSNPGWFLQRLRKVYRCETIITVPNAFADAGRQSIEKDIENVNRDHVAWYSYRTLKTLLDRYGYEIEEFWWYNGRPKFSEGLIVVTR